MGLDYFVRPIDNFFLSSANFHFHQNVSTTKVCSNDRKPPPTSTFQSTYTRAQMNISATLNVARLIFNPQLCLPHLTISSFDKIPVPVRFPAHQPLIKAIVLDKDNCFAKAHDDKVWPAYQDTWDQLRREYPDAKLLIVSNSAGTNDDKDHQQAKIIEERTGVRVLRHATKKPGCHGEIMDYFLREKIVKGPEEVAIVGDRLFTDMLMANMMGAWGIWVRDGVIRSESLICRIERDVFARLKNGANPLFPPIPKYDATEKI